jgi:hypothetical protein
MFEYGLEKHMEREEEIKQFLEAVEDAKRENKRQASAKIDEFMAYKQKVSICYTCINPTYMF